MEEKLKRTIKTSKQGIWLILVISVIWNIIAVLGTKSIVYYFENYWVSLIYILGLILGLVLYKKEKYLAGAELVQWVAFGNIIVQFVQLLTYYIITKLIALNFISFLLGTIIPIILLVESLKVIRLVEGEKRLSNMTAIAVLVILLICVTQILLILHSMNKLSSISSSNTEINNNSDANTNESQATDEEVLGEDTKNENTKQTAKEVISSYSLGEFSEVRWCFEQVGTDEKLDTGIKYYIQNSKIYYEYENKKEEITTIKGTPISVGTGINGGIFVVKVLTNDGKVWTAAPFETETDDFKLMKDLEEYKIINIGKVSRKENYEEFYYKVSDGRIINQFGFELETVKERMFDYYALVLAEIYIGEDKKISYIQGEYEQENLKYINDIKAKRIYYNMDYAESVPCYMVVDENNKIYEIVFETKGEININVQVKDFAEGKIVKEISYYSLGDGSDGTYYAEFEMMDGTVITNEIAELYYNAETFNTMELD